LILIGNHPLCQNNFLLVSELVTMDRMNHRRISPWRSTVTVAWLLTVLIGIFSPLAGAIPPPPERSPHTVTLPDSGCAVKVEDEVRAYDFVTVRFSGTKGNTLALELTGDLAHQLQFDLRAPSGTLLEIPATIDRGLQRVLLPEDGDYHLYVVMDADQARIGRSIRFILALSKETR
jgi:hypothetical protein